MSQGTNPSIIEVENLTRKRLVARRIRAADDSASRRRGLLDVKDLDRDSGLWIDPCEAVHTFGMQIALDVVFLDSALRVRKIAEGLKPNRISFCLTARSVLEVRAGVSNETGLRCGDQLLFRPASEPTVTLDSCRSGD